MYCEIKKLTQVIRDCGEVDYGTLATLKKIDNEADALKRLAENVQCTLDVANNRIIQIQERANKLGERLADYEPICNCYLHTAKVCSVCAGFKGGLKQELTRLRALMDRERLIDVLKKELPYYKCDRVNQSNRYRDGSCPIHHIIVTAILSEGEEEKNVPRNNKNQEAVETLPGLSKQIQA